MSGPPELTIVIVNWNTRDLLGRCLDTLPAGTRRRYEAWVVDNASSDGSAEMVRARFPAVHLLALQRNEGFAAGNNRALRAARLGRYALLLNPDTEVRPGAIDALCDHLDAHPEVGAAGLQLLNPDGSPQRSFDDFWFRRPLRSFLRNHIGWIARPEAGTAPPGGPRPVEWLVGACLLLRTAALEQVGLLDEEFRVYGEEVDLQWRLRRAGWGVCLLPAAHVVHHGGQATAQAAGPMALHEYRGRYLLVRKHAPLWLPAYLAKTLAELGARAAAAGAVAAVGRRGAPEARRRLDGSLGLLRAHLSPGFYRAPPPLPGADPGQRTR